MNGDPRYIIGDCREVLPTFKRGVFDTCVTSPPYWGARHYWGSTTIGEEVTLDAYVSGLVAVFALVRDALSDEGTLWVNLGDCYRNKQLQGVPWRVAFALQDDGWILRSDIIWEKANPMPESVSDRPTRSHEYLFLFSKNARYYYDAKSIQEPLRLPDSSSPHPIGGHKRSGGRTYSGNTYDARSMQGRNKRDVWKVPPEPCHGDHPAVFPSALIKPCIAAGSRYGGWVLDPFLGSGTVGLACESLGRKWVGIEANPAYETLIRQRTAQRGLL